MVHISSILLGLVLFQAALCMEEKYKRLLLNLHNKARAEEGSSDMNELVWDDVLEQEAKEWADGCVYEHQYKERGENLAMISYAWSDKKLIRVSFKGWFDEKLVYTYGQRNCKDSCHYTQLTWAKTRRVGCAFRWCDSLKNSFNDGRAWYLVCFYDPKGNFEGEKPYEKGRSCSGCQNDQTCRNDLCSGGQDPCFDVEDRCSTFVDDGLCVRLRAAMLMNCKKSCGFCTGAGKKVNWKPKTASGVCEDRVTDCQKMSRRNGCKRGAAYMKRMCKKTCNLCPGQRKTKPKTPARTKPAVCKDESEHCAYWTEIGDCERNRKFMMWKCQKSCDACPGGSRADCKDSNPGCGRWSEAGMCDKRAYMKLHCKKSCKMC